MDPKFIDTSSLNGGDVLLCYNDSLYSSLIHKATKSSYTHAAICLDYRYAAEAVKRKFLKKGGVKKILIRKLLKRYPHIAVFRQPDAWNKDRLAKLNYFVDNLIISKTGYNILGIIKFIHESKSHNISISDKLDAYFQGKLKPTDFIKKEYFCSELVVDCFIATEFIDPSASILYQSNTFSPVDLGKDSVFGTFLGYITSRNNYKFPKDDEFLNVPNYNEIFGSNIFKDIK